jgi:hypothetical protein
VTWTSSDTGVATVNSNGLVTVVGPGMATISVSTIVGDKTATCIINGRSRNSGDQGAVAAGSSTHNNGDQGYPSGLRNTASDQKRSEAGGAAGANPATANAALSLLGNQPWRVYEMSSDAVPLQRQTDQSGMDAYVAVLFLILFLWGSVRRYTKYAREEKR